MDVTQTIWTKFHIKRHDTLPFFPWLEGASRQHLAELFFELGFTKGAEIGVRLGSYSKILLDTNPNLSLLSIDPWSPYARVSQEKQDKFFSHCQRLLRGYKSTLIRKTSMDALNDVPDGSLDFVYIDGLHDFDSVMMDIICWSRKVRFGGIVSGHDYYVNYREGVIMAVNAYTYANNIHQWYITKEKEASYFWVKS